MIIIRHRLDITDSCYIINRDVKMITDHEDKLLACEVSKKWVKNLIAKHQTWEGIMIKIDSKRLDKDQVEIR